MPEFKELQINDGKILLNIARGEVVGQQKWSETEVHTSGGGGYVQQGGYVRPPQVSSTSHEKHEFWIREEGGKETAINFTDANFPVREGQKVWVAWGNNSRSKGSGSYLFGHNYASGDSHDLLRNWGTWLYGTGLLKTPAAYRFFTKWLPLIIGVIVGFVWLPLFFSSEVVVGLSPDEEALQTLRNVTNPLFVIQHWPSAITKALGKDLGAMALVAGAIWITNLLFMKFFGSMLFLKRWERKRIAEIRTKIFSTCNESESNAIPLN